MTPLTETASAVPVQGNAVAWFERVWRAGIYSASRLALNLAPNLLTLLVVRWMPLGPAHTLLTGFAAAIFLTNTTSTWLEMVIYRYSADGLARSLRRVVWIESAAAILVLLAIPSLLGVKAEFVIGIRALLAVIVVTDLIYRTSLAALQISGEDQLWIRLNGWRLLADLVLTAGAAWLTRNSFAVLAAMAVCRVCATAAITRVSPLYLKAPVTAPAEKTQWIRYGISISLWTSVLQVLQYLPQFAAARLWSELESTAFLAGFRIFVQSSLLVTGFLLLYLHPKLLGGYLQRGADHFYAQWRALLPWYGGITCLFAAICTVGYPFAAPLFLGGVYAGAARVVLWTVPGIISLSLANYVQKLLEVRENILPMTGYLAFATLLFAASMLLHAGRTSVSPRELCIAFSFAFTFYLALVSLHAARLAPRLPSMVMRPVKSIGATAFAGAAFLVYEFAGR